jgi:hypothetical protein
MSTHIHENHTSYQQWTPHKLWFLEHGQITKEVRNGIHEWHTYEITEIVPNGDNKRILLDGSEIIKKYSTIFGQYLHGFIVYEKDEYWTRWKLIFVYTGPIPQRVDTILRTIH